MEKLKKIGQVKIKDHNSGLIFENAEAAAKHFNCSKTTIVKYAMGKVKIAMYPFKLEFLEKFHQKDLGPR